MIFGRIRIYQIEEEGEKIGERLDDESDGREKCLVFDNNIISDIIE